MIGFRAGLTGEFSAARRPLLSPSRFEAEHRALPTRGARTDALRNVRLASKWLPRTPLGNQPFDAMERPRSRLPLSLILFLPICLAANPPPHRAFFFLASLLHSDRFLRRLLIPSVSLVFACLPLFLPISSIISHLSRVFCESANFAANQLVSSFIRAPSNYFALVDFF